LFAHRVGEVSEVLRYRVKSAARRSRNQRR
jgi:hypothetical protein